LVNQGKQLRPALVALAGSAIGEASEKLVTLAVIIEMVHLATLVHDDIMDEAEIRRRRPTLAARWGNEVSVLLGDCLFTHALTLAASFPTPEVCRRVAKSSGTVCAGEILQNQRRQNWQLPRNEYFRIIGMKTAELFALSCSLAANQAGGTPTEETALCEYGFNLGTAYQIYDDCLDLYGVEDDAGKSLGTDLASGKMTLPLLHFFEQAAPQDREEMISWLENWEATRFAEVREKLERYGALAESCRVIGQFLNKAREALSKLNPSPELDALRKLTEFLAQQTAGLGV
jgi:octaprenyl-diphosphate synthase